MAQRSSYQYRPHGDDQADLKKRIKEIAETRVRYGYRRIDVLLRREGWLVKACKTFQKTGNSKIRQSVWQQTQKFRLYSK